MSNIFEDMDYDSATGFGSASVPPLGYEKQKHNQKQNLSATPSAGNDTGSNSNDQPRKRVQMKLRLDDHRVDVFQVSPTVRMKKVMDSFCNKYHLDVESYRFLLDGTHVDPDDTPFSLEIENGDVIDVAQTQTGGSHPAGI
ncbi:uncharacterized protein LODBEIA_P08530 [Lodderomyces beijingensis]|uniref:Ubiquitin-like domain-containing protein n=1 Tax=Lodderomyces beijingensis TaxID=1775926 RepID=A0ABP0ZEN8_9ASCO